MKRIAEVREARRRTYAAAGQQQQQPLQHTNDSVAANATSPHVGQLDSIPWGQVSTGYFDGGQVSEYYVELSIGSPAQPVLMSIDTGSDVAWVQCLPCEECYDQSFDYFDPSQSQDFVMTNSQDPYCADLQATSIGAGADDSLCLYQTSYADGTSSFGYIAKDDFNFWDAGAGSDGVTVSVPGVAFGCGTKNTAGVQTATSGVLGLGYGRTLSMAEQFYELGEFSTAFAFCFAPIFSDPNTGWLMFGDGALAPSDYPSTPLIQGQGFQVYFYVDLVDFVVNGQQVGVPLGTFAIDPNDNKGGVIVDSGDIVSLMITAAYAPFRAAWLNAVNGILGAPGPPGPDGLDACWDYPNPTVLPPIGFLFSDGNILQLGDGGAQLIFLDDNGVQRMCWPFLESRQGETFASLVIGAISLHGMEIVLDTVNHVLAWNPDQC
ncbi:hypothetical protein L7F22_049669 [Adiantum nelumboides]|nr:hypothetical protein [Adiantum nelumboides]